MKGRTPKSKIFLGYSLTLEELPEVLEYFRCHRGLRKNHHDCLDTSSDEEISSAKKINLFSLRDLLGVVHK
jgi:hypothetical protein